MRTILAQGWQDAGYSLRVLAKSAGFTAVAAITLALGIGANAAIFSVVSAVMLRPLPYPKPEQLMVVGPTFGASQVDSSGEPQFLFTRAEQHSFSALALYQPLFSGVNFASGHGSEYVEGTKVSLDFFRVAGIEPVLGRSFTPEEDLLGSGEVVILSAGLWRRQFGADPSAIGRIVSLNGVNHTVIGVMPAGFQFLSAGDVFIPLRASMQGDPNPNYMMTGRLKDGVTIAQARADLQLVAEKYRVASQRIMAPNESLSAQPLQQYLSKDVSKLLWILLAAAGFVLLIACANVANLQLTRSVHRRKEIGIRLAIGASRGRIVWMLITEGVLLALLGGAAGVALAWWGTDYLKSFIPAESIPRVGTINLDWRVLVFALAVSMLTGVIFSLAPASHVLKVDLNDSLKEGAGKGESGGGAGRGRLRSALVAAEVALSFVLLIGAGLLIRTFVNLHHVDPGFDAKNMLSFQVTPMGPRYDSGASNRDYYERSLEKLRSIPGVVAAAMTSTMPLSSQFRLGMEVPGRAPIPESIQFRVISPDYFTVLQTPVTRGRAFAGSDALNSEPVVIVNDAFVRRYLSGTDPLSQQVVIGRRANGSLTRRIVGVAGDTKQFGLGTESSPTVYMPIGQGSDQLWRVLKHFVSMKFVVRTAGSPLSPGNAIRQAMAEVDSALPVTNLRSMEQVVDESVASERFNMALLGLFAALGLALAAVGIYGVMSYAVSQRTHEIGIRVALGAPSREVLRLVVAQGLKLTLIGLGIGLAGAFALTRLMASLLFGVAPNDVPTFIALAIVLAAVACLASYIPARRATKINPIEALRHE